MGVIERALVPLVALALGSLLAAGLERAVVRGEAGPARRVRLREGARPTAPDPWLYDAAPLVALVAVAWAAVVLPFGPELVGADLGIGLFYFIVVVDLAVLAIALGGWGANTRSAVESCYRVVAQLVSYVVPLGLAVIGPIMMARSMSTVRIADSQAEAGLWYVLAQPLGFALYVVTALMQAYRAPFLEPFAASIEGGPLPAYGGFRAAIWRVALSGLLFVVAAMGAVLFLGGWHGPWLPGPVWMLLKTALVMLVMLAVGRLVRPRGVAETIALAWKVLIPVGLANVLVVGALILLGVGQGGG
jgi:NADH-quinone oxidoreductase subunit H